MPDTRTEGDLTHNTDDASVVLQIRNKNWLRILDAYAVVVELQPNVSHRLGANRAGKACTLTIVPRLPRPNRHTFL